MSTFLITREDGAWLRLPWYNPETQVPWGLVQAEAFAHARPHLWNSPEAPQDPPPVLPDLTMRQFRLGLLSAGLLTGVSAAIDALPEPDRTAAQIEYEYAGVVVRTDPWVSTLALAMGLTDQEIDSLWAWAASL